MIKQLAYFLRIIVCWLLLFFIYRSYFLVYHYSKVTENSFSDIVHVFFNGFFLDLATACYILVLPFLLWVINLFYPKNVFAKIGFYYHCITIVLFSFLAISNVLIYNLWGTLVNYRALSYLAYPKEAMASISIPVLLLVLAQCVLLSYIGIFFFRKIVSAVFPASDLKIPKKFVVALCFPLLLFLGLRGGMQLIPINESAAYFSARLINNHIAVNPMFYLIKSINAANKTHENIYKTIEENVAEVRLKKLLPAGDTAQIQLLKNQRPNVVFIILESYSAGCVKALGAKENLSPHLDSLIRNGYLFSGVYSSGFRTDQGLVSVLSGFPAQPNNSIIKIPEKSAKLPSITSKLRNNGYNTSFYYGGEIEFANMSAYLNSSGFEQIVSLKDFDDKLTNSKWGVHDEYVFERHLKDLGQLKEPFFSVMLTLSNHEPFEIPHAKHFKGIDEATNFKNTAFYTDECLGRYLESASKTKWFENTLFVIVADHGHRLPEFMDMNQPGSKHIPLLFYGDVIKEELRGQRNNTVCNQHDICATLLNQLGITSSEFNWSKNILGKKVNQFAYYTNENVLGWITPEQEFIYTFTDRKTIFKNADRDVAYNDSLLTDGKAYLQHLYQQFIEY